MPEEICEVCRQRLRNENVVNDLTLGQRQSDDAESIDVDLFAAPEKCQRNFNFEVKTIFHLI